MNGKPRRFYEFGPFRVDDAGRRLLLEGREVTLGGEGDGRGERLPAKAFDVLLFLLRRPGETLGRQEILDAVWAEVQVEQGRVDDNISTLRKFLGDRAKNSVYIE
ncbi:MAG TPA: winged helix-turn-helix domain-containing protein, partial [Pyrinomonadaceae bacterium]